MNQKKSHRLIIVYSVAMLSILIGLFMYLVSVLDQVSTVTPIQNTEYIYIVEDSTIPPAENTDAIEEIGWIVKEHMGKIGIFKKDGTLLQILDTYVKTLPKADQALLGEGLEIETQADLNAIIEDYSD